MPITNNDTQISPGIGPLPDNTSVQGGIVVDLIGLNDFRITAQVSPNALFAGWATPGVSEIPLYTFANLTPDRVARLGGGLKALNIRVTLQDGDSGSPNPIYIAMFGASNFPYRVLDLLKPPGYDFDGGQDLQIFVRTAGELVGCGYMGQTTTFRLRPDGTTFKTYTGFPGVYALYPGAGYEAQKQNLPVEDRTPFPVTGWFSVPPAKLATVHADLASRGMLVIGLLDNDPTGDQYFDFVQGVGNTVLNIPLFPPVVLSFTATPSQISHSQTVTLTWTTRDAVTCSIDGGVGSVASSGSVQVPLTATTTFTLSISNSDGSATSSVTVPLVLTPPVIHSFTAVSSELNHAVLQWNVTGDDVLISIEPGGFSGLAASGFLDASDGATSYTLTATNPSGTVTSTAAVTVDVPPLQITTLSPLPAVLSTNRAVSIPFAAAGGFGNYTWSISAVPGGLLLNPATGVLSGVIQFDPDGETFDITVASPGVQSVTKQFFLPEVVDPVIITTAEIPPPRAEVAYSLQMQAINGMGAGTYVWSISGGSLPPGLALTPEGRLSGTPTQSGRWSASVRVDSGVSHATVGYQLVVMLPWRLLDPFRNIYYRVLNEDGTPTGITNDPHPEVGGKEPFGRMVVAFTVGTNDFAIRDTRQRGGGLAPEHHQIEQARNLWDLGYWDGKPVPGGGAFVVHLPLTLLDRFTRDEVKARVEAASPVGSLPLIRYYDAEGEELP